MDAEHDPATESPAEQAAAEAYKKLAMMVEVLEVTNEELRQTNETLDEANRDHQETIVELERVVTELEHRSVELAETTEYFSSLLDVLSFGVIAVDRKLVVRVWNRWATDEWGPAWAAEGERLDRLDVGLPLASLVPAIQRCLADDFRVDQDFVDALNWRGQPIRCHVMIVQHRIHGEIVGALLLIWRRALRHN